MHNGDGNFILLKLVHLFYHILADMTFFFFCKFSQCTVSALANGIHYLLHVKCLFAAVLFNDLHISFCLKLGTVIGCVFAHLLHFNTHGAIPPLSCVLQYMVCFSFFRHHI